MRNALAFALVAFVLVLTPGADFAVVFASALRARRLGVATSLGTVTGLLAHAAVAVAGLAAVLAASATAFTATKIAGGVFLLGLGVHALATARRLPAGTPVAADAAEPSLKPRLAYLRGLVTNLLNPKAPAIYLSLMPQFVPADADVAAYTALLSAVLITLAAGWYLTLSVAVDRLGDRLRRPAVRRRLQRVTGITLVGLGLRVLLERRSMLA